MQATTSPLPLPLAGLRILAVEQYGAGPFGTSYLADLGAEVIKIENHKEGGDIGRSVGPHYFGPGDSQFFQTFNRNKKSITHRLSVGALSQQLPLRLMDDFISKLLRL